MISLGVDIGGTGCKCVAFSDSGEQLALCYEEYPLPAGAVDLPQETLVSSVFRVIRQCADALENKDRIAAVTVSSFGESFAAVDENGEGLDDIRMYFGSSESEEFEALVQKIGAERFMKICRVLPDASYSLSKMLYTKKIAPRPVRKFLFVAGFVCFRLCARAATDVSLACRSLLYDVEKGEWSEELLEKTGIGKETLPEVLQAGTALGTILPDAAKRLGLPANTTVVLGAHDQIVNALGAGVENVKDAVDTSGTCECVTPLFAEMPSSESFVRRNFACVPYLKTGAYVTYAYNISAGSVVRWVRDALVPHLKDGKTNVYKLLDEAAPDGPTSLTVLPFLQGMGGTPDVDPAATGLIAGLKTSTRLPDIYRAILEGITFEMRYNLEKLAESGVSVERMTVCGGGARSLVWLQIKADILGMPVIPVLREETGAMGSAILGFSAVTGEDPMTLAARFRRLGTPVAPKEENRTVYDGRYEKYKQLRALYKEI